MIIEAKLYRRIERLFFEAGKRMQIEQDAVSQAYRGARDTNATGNGVSAYGDSTALAGILLAEGQGIISTEWLATIAQILKQCSRANQLHAKLIRLYYFNRIPAEEVCIWLGINLDTFYRMKNQIVYRTALAAFESGLLEREGTAWKTSA